MITELDKQKRAKQYMDRLAEGVNPLTGDQLPQDTVLNDVRLARCFFYVSSILRQVIENGGSVSARANSTALQPFRVTQGERERVKISEDPVTISVLVQAVNDAVHNPAMKKLTATTVTNWLAAEGYLQVVEDSRGRHKDLTEKSAAIGITAEERQGVSGPYLSILYNRDAQQFILDRILEHNL